MRDEDYKPVPHYTDHHTQWKPNCMILSDGEAIEAHLLNSRKHAAIVYGVRIQILNAMRGNNNG